MTINHRLFALALALASSLTQAKPVLLDQVVAVVDEDVIMQSQIDSRIERVISQNRGATLPPRTVLLEQVLERLIQESIQLQMAERIGVRISDAQLNEAIERIAARNGLGLAAFQRAMEAEGVSFVAARQQIRNEMLLSRIQRIRVGQRIEISDQDIDYFLASEAGKLASAAEYELGHILVAVPSDARASDLAKAQAKAEKLVAQLRNGGDFRAVAIAQSNGRNALKGGDLGWRKEAQLPGIFADAIPSLNIGDVSNPIQSASGFHIVKVHNKRGGATKLVTQSKVRHILISTNELRNAQQAETLIHDLYQRARNGEEFAALAKEFSDDPGSGSLGGDLGWVNPGDMVPEFDGTMSQTAIGGISAPFQSQFGWHVLIVEDRQKTDIGEQIQRNQVRQMLSARRFEEELPVWLRKIRAEAYVDIKDAS